MWISRARMSEAWADGMEKRGRMSSKRMPGEGKLGYWRREARREDLRRVSSSREQSKSDILGVEVGVGEG